MSGAVDPEKKKAYDRWYYHTHAEHRRDYNAKYRARNLSELRIKDLAHYHKNKDVINQKKTRRRLDDIEAAKKRDKEYHDKRIEYFRAANKRFRTRTKLKIMAHYGGKCACCGETHIEFLTIDHIRGGGTAHRKELKKVGQMFYDWLIKQNYPDGYQVLCFNCNCAKGVSGYCPHEKEREESKLRSA